MFHSLRFPLSGAKGGLYAGPHFEVTTAITPPDPLPTPTPNPALTHKVILPFVLSGGAYEVDGQRGAAVHYYLFNGKRVAMREGDNGDVVYLYHDHLGSTVATSDGKSTRYWPYGAARTGGVDIPYRRYAYVDNNPIRYTDPSGHMLKDDIATASYLDPRLPAWKSGIYNCVPYQTIKEAAPAYLSFIENPDPFIAMYADPDLDVQQYASLVLIAMYSEIDSAAGAAPPILGAAEDRYGLDAADALQKMRDFHVFTGKGETTSAEMGFLAFAASIAPEAPSAGVQAFVQGIKEWLGKGADMVVNEHHDYIFRPADLTRRIRFDFNRPYPHEFPHAHVEEYINGKWVKSGQIYPYDVPRR